MPGIYFANPNQSKPKISLPKIKGWDRRRSILKNFERMRRRKKVGKVAEFRFEKPILFTPENVSRAQVRELVKTVQFFRLLKKVSTGLFSLLGTYAVYTVVISFQLPSFPIGIVISLMLSGVILLGYFMADTFLLDLVKIEGDQTFETPYDFQKCLDRVVLFSRLYPKKYKEFLTANRALHYKMEQNQVKILNKGFKRIARFANFNLDYQNEENLVPEKPTE